MELLNFYNLHAIFNSKLDPEGIVRREQIIGKAMNLNELIQLPEAIANYWNAKQKGVK